MPVHSDANLVQSAQSSDERAFERLVEKYRVRIYATISGFIDNPQDREDIAQETIINAYRSLHQLSKPEHFGSWLEAIAQNQCRDWMRKNRVQTVSIDDVEENLPNCEDSPEQNSVETEQRRIIAQVIDTLPQTERQIARAHYLEDASHDELVSRHGISYQSVSARLFRAKRKLVKRLRHLLGGVLVPPSTLLKKISSGGLTAMKIGTVPKVTVGVIAIIALAFIGSRQLLSPKEDFSPSATVTVPKPSKPEQTSSEVDIPLRSTVTAPRRADEPQVSAEEMEQIEDFFAQLDEADAQSNTNQLTEAEFQQDEEESISTNTGRFAEVTEQSAEEVMNAFLEAFRILDEDAMSSLMTADSDLGRTSSVLEIGGVEIGKVLVDSADEVPDEVVVGIVEEAGAKLEQMMFPVILKMINQAKTVDSGYFGDEFHFRLRMPTPEVPMQVSGIEVKSNITPPPDLLFKMRRENGAWRIYDSETLD
ncbi:MAG: sigma-70 family RNA polymerase sigma factor [Candidatus Poribacteria bacterium]|nr:sigma-70 family RNA polymerase sigma factor [Candidatus Poribacteria bacterium]